METAGYKRAKGSKLVEFDSSLSGFGVRVYPSGKRSWWVQWNRNGRQGCKSLGSCDLVPRHKAKEQAKKILAEVLLAPEEDRSKRLSLAEFNDIYMERHARVNKRSWREDDRRADKYLLPVLGKLPLNKITRADVAALVGAVGEQFPYQANRVKEQLSKMFELAIDWGYLPDSYRNPVKGVPDYCREVPRSRWLSHEEIPVLLKAAEAENPVIGDLIKLYLLTGLRKRELLNLRWSDIDLNLKVINLDASKVKAGRHLCLPLSSQAVEILQAMPRRLGNPHVFPGSKAGAPLIGIDKIWQRVRERAGMPDVHLHDLRRTTASHMVQSGHDLHLVGQVLNQTTQSVTANYSHFATQHLRAPMEDHGTKISSLFGEVS